MNESILTTIKKLLGISEEDTSFDIDIIVNINSAFSILYQLGVGDSGFSITGSSETWSDYLEDMSKLEMIKNYIYLKVKLVFDPPQSSRVIESYENQIKELEFRINVEVDPGGN
jgi:hypothetical protein